MRSRSPTRGGCSGLPWACQGIDLDRVAGNEAQDDGERLIRWNDVGLRINVVGLHSGHGTSEHFEGREEWSTGDVIQRVQNGVESDGVGVDQERL